MRLMEDVNGVITRTKGSWELEFTSTRGVRNVEIEAIGVFEGVRLRIDGEFTCWNHSNSSVAVGDICGN